MNITAIILARGGSKGIPRKSIMNFCGKPLIVWTILNALESKHITDIYVTSEDEEIINVASQYDVNIIKRPDELATDTATAESAILHALDNIEQNIDLIIYPQITSPLRMDDDFDNAIECFTSNNFDSLFSASTLKDFCMWRKNSSILESLSYNYKDRGRRQDWEYNYYLENGSIYIFKPEVIQKYNNRFGDNIGIYEMHPWQSYELDEPDDIDICEYFMKSKVLND